MSSFVYLRDSVPVGETIRLETQFRDSAGFPKDTDTFPTITVNDASSSEVIAATSSGVTRIGIGRYRYDFLIPSGYTAGVWNDAWAGAVDGYTLSSTFDFLVDSVGTIEAIGTIVDPGVEYGDDPEIVFSKAELKGLNAVLKVLKARFQNNAFDPNGNACNVFSDQDLLSFLCASLSEFNSTPTITAYGWDNPLITQTFIDIVSQGAYLIAMSAIATVEAGREFTLNDNGVTINPPPVSSTITSLHGTLLADYRAKLKEIKRNHRPAPMGMGAGQILVVNPLTKRLRHRRENQIL